MKLEEQMLLFNAEFENGVLFCAQISFYFD